jgi:hypothetical protein
MAAAPGTGAKENEEELRHFSLTSTTYRDYYYCCCYDTTTVLEGGAVVDPRELVAVTTQDRPWPTSVSATV